MNGLKFLASPHIEHPRASILHRCGGIGWSYEYEFVLLMRLQNPCGGFSGVESVISGTNFRQSFLGLKSATCATSDVEMPEKSPLRDGIMLEQLSHGQGW